MKKGISKDPSSPAFKIAEPSQGEKVALIDETSEPREVQQPRKEEVEQVAEMQQSGQISQDSGVVNEFSQEIVPLTAEELYKDAVLE